MAQRLLEWLAWGGLLAVLGGACTMLPKDVQSPEKSFVVASDDFMRRLRWKDYNGAARYFSEAAGAAFLEQMRLVEKDLNITEVRLDAAEFRNADEAMETWLVVEFFLLPSNTLQRLRFALPWRYQRAGEKLPGEWLIVGDFPHLPGAAKP